MKTTYLVLHLSERFRDKIGFSSLQIKNILASEYKGMITCCSWKKYSGLNPHISPSTSSTFLTFGRGDIGHESKSLKHTRIEDLGKRILRSKFSVIGVGVDGNAYQKVCFTYCYGGRTLSQ
ncbi:hypothetical protein L2E82_33739 [Cichorium intybus]|uniref:Uncharacterized protein n=1 Tax=Cichorium intybus TaxID=13427 RepID=A0ACB9BL09_CICIN|nr:hypothetical protein L2E82_33739 [Cichorium intybus]